MKRDGATVEAERQRVIRHLEFTIELYRERLRHGRYFLHEHPAFASSWQEEAMKKLTEEQGVYTTIVDQCLYGCEAPNDAGWSLGDILRERLSPLNIPVVAGMPVGHGPNNFPWRVGAHARLQANGLTWTPSA